MNAEAGTEEIPKLAKALEAIDAAATDHPAMLAACRDAVGWYPKSPRAWFLLMVAHMNLGDRAKAVQALDTAAELGLPRIQELRARARLAERFGDAGGLEEAGRALEAEGLPMAADIAVALFDQNLARGRPAEAEALIDRQLARQRTPALLGLKLAAMIERCDDAELEAEIEALVLGPDGGPGMVRLIRLLHNQVDGGSERVLRLARAAVEAWPGRPETAGLEDILAHAGTGREAELPADPARRLAALLDAFEAWSKTASREDANLAGPLRAQIRPGDLRRQVIGVPSTAAPVVTEPCDGGHVAVVFTGLRDRTSVPLPVIDAYLAAAGIAAVYVFDPDRLIYCTGIATLGSNFDTARDGLAQLLADRGGYRRLTCIGSSAGGLAALNYGLALGADRVLSLSGPTCITADFLDRHDDRRGRIIAARILRDAPADLRDVRPRTIEAAGKTRIDLVHGQDMAQDRAHAGHLEGLPGVRIVGLAGYGGHASFRELIRRDLARDVIAGRGLPDAARVTL